MHKPNYFPINWAYFPDFFLLLFNYYLIIILLIFLFLTGSFQSCVQQPESRAHHHFSPYATAPL